MNRLLSIILIILFVLAAFPVQAQAAEVGNNNVKELNFVFLHGLNSTSKDLQLLEDSIADRMPAYITNYQYNHPDINILTNDLIRSYPNNVDIQGWAQNIADAINKRFAGKKNLVLIGHSMGGKTALYAVAHNIGNIADKVAMVVTINSPIKSLVNYYYISGDSALDYWAAKQFLPNRGAVESLVNYDSSQDGQWVATHKHWLAFISAESSPQSPQFDVNGVDPLPRNMDDQIVPISAQYADGADVVYYGEYAHGDFTELADVAGFLADQTLRYVFGGNIQCSVFAQGGAFDHKAAFFPGTEFWQDTVGEVLAGSGTLSHRNDSYFQWQEWADVVGGASPGSTRSSFQTTEKKSFPILTGIKQVGWLSPDDPLDGRISVITRAAPRSSVQVDWSVYQVGLLPSGIVRDHYEVEIDTGTQFTSIGQVGWETGDPRDLRLLISSQAPGPFRWFEAQWRVYYKESRQRKIIDSLPIQTVAKQGP